MHRCNVDMSSSISERRRGFIGPLLSDDVLRALRLSDHRGDLEVASIEITKNDLIVSLTWRLLHEKMLI